MGIREEIDKLPPKSAAEYKAKALVEIFHSNVENRNMRSLDNEPEYKAQGKSVVDTEVLLERKGVRIHTCAYDSRGIVEIMCTSDNFVYDLPIYIVNPPLLVEDNDGHISIVREETVRHYREDPIQAMVDLLVDLKNESTS